MPFHLTVFSAGGLSVGPCSDMTNFLTILPKSKSTVYRATYVFHHFIKFISLISIVLMIINVTYLIINTIIIIILICQNSHHRCHHYQLSEPSYHHDSACNHPFLFSMIIFVSLIIIFLTPIIFAIFNTINTMTAIIIVSILTPHYCRHHNNPLSIILITLVNKHHYHHCHHQTGSLNVSVILNISG